MARVTVAPEVALDWDRGEGEVRLVLRSDAHLPAAFAAMAAVCEQVRTVEIEMWEPTALPFGVGLYVVMDPPQYDAVLDGLVAGLEARGISGVLSSHGPRVDDPRHPLDDERLAHNTEVITCRVSVVGQPSPPSRWRVDGSLIDRLAAALVWWCHDGDPSRDLHHSGADFAVSVDGDEAVRLLSLQLRDGSPREHSVTAVLPSGRVRQVDFGLQFGYVALVSTSGGPMGDGWREHVHSVRAGLGAVAGFARYAMVRRGTMWRYLASPLALALDWVAMQHLRRPRRLARALPLEDRLVPDAFGIQLLGPGHAAGMPHSERWSRVPVGAERVLMEHRDLEAWYAQQRPDEATLRAARDEFRQLLMDDDLLAS